MKNFIFSVIAFVAGGTIGYFIGKKTSKKKYQQIADKEIESVKESLSKYYEDKLNSNSNPNENIKTLNTPERPKANVPLLDKDSIDYGKLKGLKDNDKAYMNYVKSYNGQNAVKEEMLEDNNPAQINGPFVISPEEYADGEYNTETLHYYKDGYLTDDEYNIIKNVNEVVGNQALNSFGVYEEDTVYVRNDEHKIDYEILFEDEEYKNVAPKGILGNFPGNDE